MDSFRDKDGDRWTRGEHRGEVVISRTVWRKIDDKTLERRLTRENHWYRTTIDRIPLGGPCILAAIAALWPDAEHSDSVSPPKVDAPAPRRIIQLSLAPPLLAALCDDGTAWTIHDESGAWKRLPPIPQDTP